MSKSSKTASTKPAAKPTSKATSKAPAKTADVEEKKEEPKPSVLPSDILRAINDARKKDPKDKHGDAAFRIDKSRLRAFQNKNDKKRKAVYIPFQVHVRGEWVGINIRIMNVKTEASIKQPEEREYGVDLVFRKSSKFVRKDRKTNKEIEELYGEAVIAVYEAFQRIVNKMVQAGELENKDTTALSKVQYTAKNKETKKDENLEDPIFRVALRVGEDGTFTDLQDEIRDVRRALDKKEAKGAAMPYGLALDAPEEDGGKPLTPDTVHTFFRNKTPVFGVHCLDQVCLSTQGISVPGFMSLLAGKKPKGAKPTYDAHFDKDEMAEWADADAFEPSGDEGDEGDGGGEDADVEEAPEGEYDDVLEAVADAASDKEDAAEEGADAAEEGMEVDAEVQAEAEATPLPEVAENDVDEAELDALEEKVEPAKLAVKASKPAAKAPTKKGGKK